MAASAEVSAFLEDLFENLAAVESAVSLLEDNPADRELLNTIFRAAHTIKGNASMMNLTNLVALGHALETALQEALTGELEVNRNTLRLFNECRSSMLAIGEALRSGQNAGAIAIRGITDRIQLLLLEGNTGGQKSTENQREIRLHISRAELAPSVRAFLAETKLAELGTIIRKEPSDEYLESPEFIASPRLLTYVLQTSASTDEIRENLNIDLIEDISISEIADFKPGTSAAVEQKKAEVIADVHTGTGDTIRLAVKTLDRLLNLTGELVIANSGLTLIAEDVARIGKVREESLRLTEKNREIFRIAAEIQSIVMKSRMLPVEHVFSRFKRFVADYADKAGKAIRLEISGEDTELDKRVIDEIVKPLTHLIRNALDHGFETREERLAQNKPVAGTLKISATQAGSSIFITVADDGRGLDLGKILERAVSKNLVTNEKAASLTPEEIREFIFMPGFSTRDTADDLSGRGFGMDIVRDSIKKLSGDLTVFSVKGEGTQMVMKLPLTLAILTALTFKVRDDVFAIPLGVIEESLRVPAGSIVQLDGKEMLHARNTMLPFIRLDRVLGYPPAAGDETPGKTGEHEYAIAAEIHGQKVALGIDQFLKKQELVVKSLGENYRNVPGLAGASMLGDGDIIFIIDLEEIIGLYNRANSAGKTGNDAAAYAPQTLSEKRDDRDAARAETPPDPDSKMKPLIETMNKDLVRKWIAQSNKAAVQGIQMLTGNSTIAVRKSRGSRVKADKSHTIMEKILGRAEDIFLIHLPMLPNAGAIDLILNKTGAFRMAQLLFDAAGIKHEGEFDPSPLLEITNILGSAYTNTLTFLTETSVEPATPTLMATAAEITALLKHRLESPRTELLLIENQFHIEDEDIEVELMIYLTGGDS